MAEPRVLVIGAGIGGLACALQLAHRGLRVTVLERSDAPGGKLRSERVDGAAIDAGPTVFTLRWVFDELLHSVGRNLDLELSLERLPVIARHFWPDGSRLDLLADAQASEAQVEAFAGADEAARFRRYCATTRALYDRLEGSFIRSQAPNLPGFMLALGTRGLGLLAGLGPMRSLWDSLGRQFSDPRLRQMFARYATYCGSSPWQAPATLGLIAQVEMDGVWSVCGGMAALAECLERLVLQAGGEIRYRSHCEAIETDGVQVRAVRLAEGERLPADVVVFNGDVSALRDGLLGSTVARAHQRQSRGTRSLSALTWALRAQPRGLPLDRHNLFFGHDYAREFDDILVHRRLPHQPTVYLCAQDRGAGASAAGAERLLALVNAPAVGDRPDGLTDQAIDACQRRAQALLSACGLELAIDAAAVRTDPRQFHQRYPGTGGALYGQATHGWMSIFSRPGSVSPIPGLYLAGGSVHPGPGVPMAAMSGRLAAAAVMERLASTSRSRRVAISGGTSTPSAMTASTGSP